MTRIKLFPLFLLILIVLGIPSAAPVYATGEVDVIHLPHSAGQQVGQEAAPTNEDQTPPDIAWITTSDQVSGAVDLALFIKEFDSMLLAVELSFDEGQTWERHQLAFFEGMAAPANWKELAQETTWTLHGFDTREYENGPLTILARAQDHAGNMSPVESLTISVENR